MKFQTQMITGPTAPVVTVADLKTYLRIDNALEDNLLLTMERAAVLKLEAETSLKFVEQVWDIFMDHWPMARPKNDPWWDGTKEIAISEVYSTARNVVLPLGKAIELVAFSTYSDDTEFPANPSDYVLDSAGTRARVGLRLGAVWPTTILRPNNGIRFRLKLGFGAAATAVPSDIIQAVKEFVSHMYENRGDQNEMTIPPHVLLLVEQYRRLKLGC